MGELWNVAFLQPLLNGLILLSGVLFHNFGLTILVFTIIIRILILWRIRMRMMMVKTRMVRPKLWKSTPDRRMRPLSRGWRKATFHSSPMLHRPRGSFHSTSPEPTFRAHRVS